MIKEFTFGVLTYNQEEYVLQNLKSILYQIKKYGVGISVDLVISDDCSKDNTIAVIKNWIEKNGHYFRKIEILQSSVNMGTVQNYIRTLKFITTEKFKILAGDDLYFENDVFSAVEKGTLTICPCVAFSGNNVWLLDNYMFYNELYPNKDNSDELVQILQKRLLLHKILNATTYYFDKTLIDDFLISEIVGYTWIEDYPLMNGLLKSKKIKIHISELPLSLYRTNSGISTNPNHSKRKEFVDEEKIVFKNICIHYKKFRKLNPYVYQMVIKRGLNKLFNRSGFEKSKKEYEKLCNNIKEHYESYLLELNSDEYK